MQNHPPPTRAQSLLGIKFSRETIKELRRENGIMGSRLQAP